MVPFLIVPPSAYFTNDTSEKRGDVRTPLSANDGLSSDIMTLGPLMLGSVRMSRVCMQISGNCGVKVGAVGFDDKVPVELLD